MAPPVKPAMIAAGAVAATAAAGGAAADPRSDWYQSLRKPSWQPPPWAFPLVWTPLYVSIGYAGARALARQRDHGPLIRALLTDLALNAAWTAVFFRVRKPRAALAEIAGLNLANAALIRRAWQADRTAALLLLPYAAWTGFATALNTEIVLLNPGV